MVCVLFGNNVTKHFIGRSKKSQTFKSHAYSHFLKQMFLSWGNGKVEKSKGRDEEDKEKCKFTSLGDLFTLLLELYVCDFYNLCLQLIFTAVFEIKLIF